MVNWVCVSDLHAGGLTSLLHALPGEFEAENEVVTCFSRALGAFLGALGPASADKPQLVLLGDILDLQFSKRHLATRDAIPFLAALHGTGCFAETIIATAGNHDHTLWTEARLALEAQATAQGRSDSPTCTAAFRQTPDATSGVLQAVVQQAGFAGLDLRYPNIGFAHPKRAVVLHHGHYTEGLYRLVSTLKDALCARPAGALDAATLAAENAAWIDFAWSPFNDADDLERLYQNFLTTAGFRRITKGWTDKAAHALSEALPLSGNPALRAALHSATRLAVEATLGRARDTERMAEVISLTDEGRAGLRWYLEQPVLEQLHSENPGFAGDVTFVLGHTHRPFSLRLNAQGYDAPVRVYNTGGWTLNGPRLDNAEGAALVLIDADLNTASLRLFGTPHNGVVPPARIEMLSNATPGEEAFRDALHAALAATAPLWAQLSGAVKRAYLARQALLLDLTADPQEAAQ